MLKQDIELMQRALGICEVLENGELRLGGRFSDNELMRVYQLLSTDLLSLNIPHYKVVGIVFPRFESKSNSIIKQNDTFSDTFIELNNKLHNMIPIYMGGNDKEKGCYCYSDKAVFRKDFYRQDVDSKAKGSSDRLDILRKPLDVKLDQDCLFIKNGYEYNPDEIGQLSFCTYNGRVINKDTLYYYQAGNGFNTENRPSFLIEDIDYTTVKDGEFGKMMWITFLYQKGVGVLDFSQTAKMFDRNAPVFPTRVEYDLSKYILLPYPTLGAQQKQGFSSLKIHVTDNVNKSYLGVILRDYAKGLK